MTTIYNRAEDERLIAEAASLLRTAVWTPMPDAPSRRLLAAMAEQLEAARAEVERLRAALLEACDAIDSAHEDQRATGQPMTSPIADRLRALLK